MVVSLFLVFFFVAFTKSFSAKPASKHTLHVRFYLLDIGRNNVCGKFPFHLVFDSLPFRYTFLKFSALI